MKGRQQDIQYDVCVVGGGSAGVAAAAAAARLGARTLLLEKFSCLGGASTMRNVTTYCGIYTLSDTPEKVVAGIADEVIGKLAARNAVTGPHRHRGVFLIFDPEAVKIVLDEVCTEAGVDVLLGATLVSAKRDGDHVTSITYGDHSGLTTIHARAFVDCTGDGDLIAFSGAATRYGNNGAVNLGTLGTRFGGIPEAVIVTAQDIATAVERRRTIADGRMTKDRSIVARLPYSADLVCYVASEDYDPRDSSSFSRAERDARRQAWEYLEAIRTIPGCEIAYLVSTGPEIGTREARHIESMRQFQWLDIAERCEFDDCIALGAWGAEWHERTDYESTFEYPPSRGAYQVPLSCLRSIDTLNLLAAGRLADGDRLAGAAIRVMGTAFATGQAVGITAALVAAANPWDAADVRNVIRKQGGILEAS